MSENKPTTVKVFMFRYTVTIEKGKQIVFDDGKRLVRGKKIYASLDEETKSYVSTSCETLKRAVEKGIFLSFKVSLL